MEAFCSYTQKHWLQPRGHRTNSVTYYVDWPGRQSSPDPGPVNDSHLVLILDLDSGFVLNSTSRTERLSSRSSNGKTATRTADDIGYGVSSGKIFPGVMTITTTTTTARLLDRTSKHRTCPPGPWIMGGGSAGAGGEVRSVPVRAGGRAGAPGGGGLMTGRHLAG
ncbi:hypothetical protein EVAR_13079_1 [Eumeta japonica]|uniref:Uncharacterized protein n=1 Tax=Eumeta variegata TaxID=151549 RepID=A0A4C2A771_EUMVA|nr:hypothetical protein EVAR_13079_1 [Eumeta japonica]